MRIGLGVTTYQRPDHIKLWQEQIRKHTDLSQCEVYIASDSYIRMGIAYRKNECLKALKDCDYIFLFDDDCFPIKTGWTDFFIEAHKASKQYHFLYLKETSTIKKNMVEHNIYKEPEGEKVFTIQSYNNCGGCFMFLTKKVIEKVGGYNKHYGYYGLEHAGYSQRIHASGLTPMGAYLCPAGAGEYIYAMDYDFSLPFNKQVNHHPSMVNELEKVSLYIEQNRKVFEKDILITYQPL